MWATICSRDGRLFFASSSAACLAGSGVRGTQVFLTGFYRHGEGGARLDADNPFEESQRVPLYEMRITEPPAGAWAFAVRYQNRRQMVEDGFFGKQPPAHRKVGLGLAMIPEGRLIFADQTVEGNLILGAYRRWRRERAEVDADFERVFELFPRLKERLQQRAGSLSGGEQQMLAIARGLLSKPKLLIIDELSLGLAPKIVEQLMEVLRSLNAQGLTILLVEQLASHALAIAHRAYVVANGRIALEGDVDTLSLAPEVMEAFLGKKRAVG